MAATKVEWKGLIESLHSNTSAEDENTTTAAGHHKRTKSTASNRSAKSVKSTKSAKSAHKRVASSSSKPGEPSPSDLLLLTRYNDASRTVPPNIAHTVPAVLECLLYAVDESATEFAPPDPPAPTKKKKRNGAGSPSGSRSGSRGASRNATPASKVKEATPGEGKEARQDPQEFWKLSASILEAGDRFAQAVRVFACSAKHLTPNSKLLLVVRVVGCVGSGCSPMWCHVWCARAKHPAHAITAARRHYSWRRCAPSTLACCCHSKVLTTDASLQANGDVLPPSAARWLKLRSPNLALTQPNKSEIKLKS